MEKNDEFLEQLSSFHDEKYLPSDYIKILELEVDGYLNKINGFKTAIDATDQILLLDIYQEKMALLKY